MDLDDDELKATREFYEKKRKQKLDQDKEGIRKYINEKFKDDILAKFIFGIFLD